jgi:hypothetical protein
MFATVSCLWTRDMNADDDGIVVVTEATGKICDAGEASEVADFDRRLPRTAASRFSQGSEKFACSGRTGEHQPDRTVTGFDGDVEPQESTALPLCINGRRDR